jgi:hypothetical protein
MRKNQELPDNESEKMSSDRLILQLVEMLDKTAGFFCC